MLKSRRHAADLRFAETVSRRFVTPLRHSLADVSRYFARLPSVQLEIPGNVQGECQKGAEILKPLSAF
jgi:hypothetical protein